MGRSGGYKCYNIHCNSCIGKTLCGEPEDKALGCDSRIVTNKSNGESIRAMSGQAVPGFKLVEGRKSREWAGGTDAACGGEIAAMGAEK